MRTTRLGCTSGSGIIIALIALLVIAGISTARGGVLFNPGALNAQAGVQTLGGVNSHAETGGRCSTCHTAVWENEKMADRCLTCHQELQDNPKDFHNVMLAQSQIQACHNCHTEHGGVQASLTIMDLNRFPHDAAGYSLKAHQKTAIGASFACSDCHGSQVGAIDPAACADCHQGIDKRYMEDHLAAFGSECLVCHDGLDTYGKAFDHNQQTFPLRGAHTQATCSQCHAGARSIGDLLSISADCYACHAEDDEHLGRFGQDCAGCHTPDGWEGAAFDHSLADFMLIGEHLRVACESCHLDGIFQGTPKDCYSCHADDDPHQGQFGQDCAQCHTAEGWDNAAFDHSLASFQLTGAHSDLPCTDCHTSGIFKGTPATCSACHSDPVYHLGQFGGDCMACHNTAAWSPAIFDQPHTFPFNHGESGINACRECHPDNLVTYSCYTCHEHSLDSIDRKHREEGISNFEDCTRCHPTGHEEEGQEREGDDD